jgi:hypothetical protein
MEFSKEENMNKVIHILRYGTVAEKIHLEKAINAYDYLSINGNSAAYVSRAIAKFVVEKFFSKPDKGFIIDPITYAFQQNIHLLKHESKSGEVSLKKSIKKLIDNYQEPANKVEMDVPIQPKHFIENQSLLTEFCTRVLNFQYSIISNYISDNDLKTYLQYATGNPSGLLPQFHPKVLIAPYFYLNSNDSDFNDWLKINVDFVKESVAQVPDQFNKSPVFGQIVINKDVLINPSVMHNIISAYKDCKCDGFSIWVDNFNEHEEHEEYLMGFINFIYNLKRIHPRIPIFNMYGGFFSVMLTHPSIHLLDGVSHGMEYGESREVYPVGGGIPVSKYYYMPLHRRTDFTKAFYLLEFNNILDTSLENWGPTEKYFKEICRCEQCRKIMGKEMVNFVEFESKDYYVVKQRNNNIIRRKKASAETKENCLYHYLLCKKMEFSTMKLKSISDILNELKIEKEKYAESTLLESDELDYIDNWRSVISNFFSKDIKVKYA